MCADFFGYLTNCKKILDLALVGDLLIVANHICTVDDVLKYKMALHLTDDALYPPIHKRF